LEQIGSNGQLRVVHQGVNLFLAETGPAKHFVLAQSVGLKDKPLSLSGKVGFQAKAAPLSSNGKKRAPVGGGASRFRISKPAHLAVIQKRG
jgi:hypothetical protein